MGTTGVLVAAAGAPWETDLLHADRREIVVVRRCVDLADLLAAAATGQADVAVVAADLPGLDAASVAFLLKHDVRTLAVGTEGLRSLGRIGVVEVIPDDRSAGAAPIVAAIRRTAATAAVLDPEVDLAPAPVPEGHGRVVAVWGAQGAPGRTTLACALAATLASRRTDRGVLLLDLDPYGGAVAQQLGILDEASGLLAASRLLNAGELDRHRFAATRRRVGDRLQVLTGLPRADRWIEVRERMAADLVELAAAEGDVVLDTGFSLEDDDTDYGRPGGGRNRMTIEAVHAADDAVVVGSADPIGLARLARALVELRDLGSAAPVHVVVNRMRDSLGWREGDIRGMVEGFTRPASVSFLPFDQATCDRALVAGTAVSDADSALGSGIGVLVETLFPDAVSAVPRKGGRRRA